MTFLTYDEVVSTNDQAKDLAKKGAVHGTAILARKQMNGRGQYEREWHSPEGGMWLSVILQKLPIDKDSFTVNLGEKVISVLEDITNKSFTIKLPNDILYSGKKLCGILVELVTKGTVTYGVVGIGLNVNNKHFPSHLDMSATSLIMIDGIERDIIDIAKRITKSILEEKDVNRD